MSQAAIIAVCSNKYTVQILQILVGHFIHILYHLDTPTTFLQGSDVAIDGTVAGHLQGIQRHIYAKCRTYNQNTKIFMGLHSSVI